MCFLSSTNFGQIPMLLFINFNYTMENVGCRSVNDNTSSALIYSKGLHLRHLDSSLPRISQIYRFIFPASFSASSAILLYCSVICVVTVDQAKKLRIDLQCDTL